MATAGTYDVYIAFKERVREKAPKSAVPKMGVLKTQVTVPDFYNGELATSTILVADKVNMLTARRSARTKRASARSCSARRNCCPRRTWNSRRATSSRSSSRSTTPASTPAGKPNLILEYEFHKTEGTGEKFFNKTNPQTVNAANLPPQFDPAKFPVPGGITVPLASFGEGQLPPGREDHRQGVGQDQEPGHQVHR